MYKLVTQPTFMVSCNKTHSNTRRKFSVHLIICCITIVIQLGIVGPSPLYKGAGGGIGSVSISHKRAGDGKVGASFKKKKRGVGGGGRGVSLIFILTNPFQCYRSPRVCCVCVCVCARARACVVCVLFIYTISISIIRVSQEEPSFITCNQQI